MPSDAAQTIVKIVVAVSAPLPKFPEVPVSVPVQTVDEGLAEAVQLVAPVELQVSVTALPLLMLLLEALSVAVGAGGAGASCRP